METNALYDYLQNNVHLISETIATMSFEAPNGYRNTSIICYAKILELSESISLLLGNGPHTAIPSIFRSQLEAYAQLKCLEKGDQLYHRILKYAIVEKRKVLQCSLDRNNPYLSSYREGDRFNVENQKLDLMENALPVDTKPLSIREQFHEAGLLNLYDSPYRDLSADAHNTVFRLHGRKGAEFENSNGLGRRPKWTSEELIRYVDGTIGILVLSTQVILTMFGIPEPEVVQVIEENRKKLYESWAASHQ